MDNDAVQTAWDPLSNQQSITSGTRCIGFPHFGHRIVTSSIYGLCNSISSGQLSDMDFSSSIASDRVHVSTLTFPDI